MENLSNGENTHRSINHHTGIVMMSGVPVYIYNKGKEHEYDAWRKLCYALRCPRIYVGAPGEPFLPGSPGNRDITVDFHPALSAAADERFGTETHPWFETNERWFLFLGRLMHFLNGRLAEGFWSHQLSFHFDYSDFPNLEIREHLNGDLMERLQPSGLSQLEQITQDMAECLPALHEFLVREMHNVDVMPEPPEGYIDLSFLKLN